MTKRLLLAGLLIATGAATGGDLLACGDKFLIVSRGTRFQRAALRTSASILVVADPASNLPKALANVPVDATLRKAGYTPTTVTNAADLEAALARGGWDLVLVDVAASQAITGRTRGAAAPMILPVVYNASGADLAQAKKQYPLVLKSPTKNQAFLDTIDEAIALKTKPQAKTGSKTGD
jgi:hypothetical protein